MAPSGATPPGPSTLLRRRRSSDLFRPSRG
ncbi:hypothetical protein E2C01_081596 [Portunus trituberculatus]|uniref:Uncharacterized protein n=1 Tax=Portunus trituberculatus TaxID=210409 RepID=A0A5B7IQ68_PORTR|nr:hypothetical protein [Portunus trituberculatus]